MDSSYPARRLNLGGEGSYGSLPGSGRSRNSNTPRGSARSGGGAASGVNELPTLENGIPLPRVRAQSSFDVLPEALGPTPSFHRFVEESKLSLDSNSLSSEGKPMAGDRFHGSTIPEEDLRSHSTMPVHARYPSVKAAHSGTISPLNYGQFAPTLEGAKSFLQSISPNNFHRYSSYHADQLPSTQVSRTNLLNRPSKYVIPQEEFSRSSVLRDKESFITTRGGSSPASRFKTAKLAHIQHHFPPGPSRLDIEANSMAQKVKRQKEVLAALLWSR